MTEKKRERIIYLENTPRQEALHRLLKRFQVPRVVEWVPTVKALGRVTAEPVYALLSMPHYNASAMDGIAVRAKDTLGAHEQQPKELIEGESFVYVDTGDPIPLDYDAVVMIEHVQEKQDGRVEIIEPAVPWQHIRPVGEDVVSGEMLLPQGHKIRPVDQGALLAGGILSVPVVKKPVVAIIPTGSELVPPTAQVNPGQIIEFNGPVLAGYVQEWGGEPYYYGIVDDEPEQMKKAILECVQRADLVLINAGSSAGSKDYTAHIIDELGEVFVHGVATRPGKPVVLGKVQDTPVIGLPGYPVSAYLAMEWFVQPLIYHYLGLSLPQRPTLEVTLGRRLVSSMGSEDFIRLNIGYVNGRFIANPLTRAAGVTMSLVRADGLLVIPPERAGYEQGEKVTVELFKPVDVIKNSIMFCGGHDLSIDLLSSLIRERDPSRQMISSFAGSMAGLMAIKKGEAHVAGLHLLDDESGEYNLPFIHRYLKGEDVVLIRFLRRQQGFIVAKGNPHQVKSVRDIAEKNLMFVNRQRGAGTRILFDLMLRQANLSPEAISGYGREMYTHLSVAAAVKNGTADVALGIYAAAKALGLDFIPVALEAYDLLMSRTFYESDGGQLLLEIIRSDAFKVQIEKLGGYQLDRVGHPIYPI